MKEKEKDYPSTSSSSSSSSSVLQTQLFIWLSHPPDMATSLLAVQTQLAHVRFNNYKIWRYCFILCDYFILFFLQYIYSYFLEFLYFAVIHDIIDIFLFFLFDPKLRSALNLFSFFFYFFNRVRSILILGTYR